MTSMFIAIIGNTGGMWMNKTTVQLSEKRAKMMKSILLKDETFDDAVLMLQWIWMNPNSKKNIKPHIRQHFVPALTKEENERAIELLYKKREEE